MSRINSRKNSYDCLPFYTIMHGPIHNAYCAARKNDNRIFVLIVVISSFVFAFALSFTLKGYVEPLSRIGGGKSDVIGWISVNEHNKPLETVYYVSALVFIPLITLTGCALWIAFSAAGAALTRRPIERILKCDALSYLAFLLVLSRYVSRLFPGSAVLLPFALFLLPKMLSVL